MDQLWAYLSYNLPSIITIILNLGIVAFLVSKGAKVLREVQELLAVVIEALKDSKITKEELDKITKEAKDIAVAWKEVTSKKSGESGGESSENTPS